MISMNCILIFGESLFTVESLLGNIYRQEKEKLALFFLILSYMWIAFFYIVFGNM